VRRYPDSKEFSIEAVRSRGPGGQNVNKTNSAAILRWNLTESQLPQPIKDRLLHKLGPKLTNEGEILIRSEEQRDLEQNRNTCVEKLHQMIDQALFVPKKRIKTKPGKSAVKKRLDTKKKHGDKKKGRQTSWD
jgi:ribosome-associated protein